MCEYCRRRSCPWIEQGAGRGRIWPSSPAGSHHFLSSEHLTLPAAPTSLHQRGGREKEGERGREREGSCFRGREGQLLRRNV